MKITFLGTGTSQGVPVIGCSCAVCASADPRDKRLRTSIMVTHQDRNLVVDTGPDFRQQMLTNEVQHLEAILFTHEHRDHTAGLDDVRAFNFKQRQAANIFATPHVQRELKKQFAYIFSNSEYPGIPKVNLHDIEDHPFSLLGLTITPINVVHYKLPVVGFRFNNFTYITDANYIPPEELEKVRGSEVLVLNALRQESHISHFTLEEALELIEEIAPQKAYLTHLSHQMGSHEAVSLQLPSCVHLAYDGLTIAM